MLANYSINILMILFSLITLSAPVAYIFILAPRHIERRKTRQIAQLVSGAELLADAISRNQDDSTHLARLTAQYDAHARALTQLGTAVPPVGGRAPMQQAA